jgi:hypothetical protein
VLEAQQRLLNAGFTYEETSTMLQALAQQQERAVASCMDMPSSHVTAEFTTATAPDVPGPDATTLADNTSTNTPPSVEEGLADKIGRLEQRLDGIQLDLTRALLQQPDMGLLPAEAAAPGMLSAGVIHDHEAYSRDAAMAGMSSSSYPRRQRRSGILWRGKVAQPLAARGRRPERYLTDDWASGEEEGSMVPYNEGGGTAAASVVGWLLGGYLTFLLCIVMLAADGV